MALKAPLILVNGKIKEIAAPDFIGIGRVHANKAADTSRDLDIVPSADPDLDIPLLINTEYVINSTLFVFSTDKKPDILLGFTIPAGASMSIGALAGIAGTPVLGKSQFYNTSGVTGDFVIAADTVTIIQLMGKVNMGATPGNLTLIWSQDTSDTKATVLQANSYLEALQRS